MKFDLMVALGYDPYIRGTKIIMVHTSTGWYVIAASEDDDSDFPPLGPFPTPEAAMVHVRLSKDK